MMRGSNTSQCITIMALDNDIRPSMYYLDDTTCTLGRSPLCRVVVPKRIVSRLHAQIERVEHRYLLLDIGSANGTFLNGRRITEPQMLVDRDEIGLGMSGAMLRFVVVDSPSSDDQTSRRNQPDGR